ncbi:hypothetical protein HY17_16650 [Hyphomonas sp. CY54-11-8]|nr:hypothetical protein HY17_16650 [Hyphomonas sp. CY54-11-8]
MAALPKYRAMVGDRQAARLVRFPAKASKGEQDDAAALEVRQGDAAAPQVWSVTRLPQVKERRTG